MEAIRKQASKLREQVAKQQQAVLKQLGHFGDDASVFDETDLQCHQYLQNLYNSTRAAKHFQKNIVRGVEGFVSSSSKQMDIVKRLAGDCCKYGVDNDNKSTSSSLARAALHFGTSHGTMEKEKETLLATLKDQVSELLRTQITGAPLEDARQLTRHYGKLRQEVESQAAEVLRRRSKFKDSAVSTESSMRLQSAEARLDELKSTMTALGREAAAAMQSVEDQQQQITFEKLLIMVDAERSYHQNVLAILERLNDEMVLDAHFNDSSVQPTALQKDVYVQPAHEDPKPNGVDTSGNNSSYFFAKVIHPFDAQAEEELSLSVDDFVVVRKVGPNGWSEGECLGKAGWFPSAYIEREDKAPACKVIGPPPILESKPG